MRWLLLAAVIVGGCSATPYQPHDGGRLGGYSETQINERSWNVYFNGNGRTSLGEAQRHALRRAAELTLQNGFSGFVIAGQDAQSEATGAAVNCFNYGNGFTQCAARQNARPNVELDVVMLTAGQAHAAVSAGRRVFDAAMLLNRLAPAAPTKPLASAYIAR